jgi:hypothetical protein
MSSLRDYLGNKISKQQFKSKLAQFDVKIDERMNTLIRRTESSDAPSFKEFGAHLNRNLNGTSTYNRVDKVNMNNQEISRAENSGKSFGFTKGEIDTKTYDSIH